MDTPFRSPRHNREVLVSDWRDAEELAAWYMRHSLGCESVRLTANGADGGIDVISAQASAQVKHYAGPVGAPEIQQAKGAAHGSRYVLFFALTGYTKHAQDFASAAGVALFSYNVYGEVVPENVYARTMLEAVPKAAAGRAQEEEAAAAFGGSAKEEEERIRVQKEADELETVAIASEAAIVTALRLATELSVTVSHTNTTDATRSFVLGEYTSYFRPQGRIEGSTMRESAHRILEILEWARTDRWLDWKGYRVRFLRSPVEAAARELLVLHDEITDVAKLRTLSLSEWVTILCDWELREAQIEAFIDAGCVWNFEDVPDARNMALRVTRSFGECPAVLKPLPSRWPREARENVIGEEANKVVVALNPMGLGKDLTERLFIKYQKNQQIRTSSRGVPCYPLGSSPKKVRQLRLELKRPSLQLGKLPGPQLIEAPLKAIKTKVPTPASNPDLPENRADDIRDAATRWLRGWRRAGR